MWEGRGGRVRSLRKEVRSGGVSLSFVYICADVSRRIIMDGGDYRGVGPTLH